MGSEQFSTTNERGQEICNCPDGNIFFVGNPNDVKIPPISAYVNGQSSGSLPMCEVVNDKTRETTGSVEIEVGGRKFPIISDLSQYGEPNFASDIQVRVGVAKPPEQVVFDKLLDKNQPGELADLRHSISLDGLSERYNLPEGRDMITTVEVETTIGPPPSGYKATDVDSLSDEEAEWVGYTIAGYLSSLGGAFIEYDAILKEGNNRQFLKELGFNRMKFWKDPKSGATFVSFKGNNKLRTLVTGTRYNIKTLLNGKKITVIEAGARTMGQNALAATTSIGSKAGIVGMIFVAAVDIGAFLLDPSAEKTLNDLFVDLGFDLLVGVVSGILATVAVGLGMAAGAFAAPAIAVFAAGAIVAVGIGILIDSVFDHFHAREKIKEALNNLEYPDTITDKIYQGMMTAP